MKSLVRGIWRLRVSIQYNFIAKCQSEVERRVQEVCKVEGSQKEAAVRIYIYDTVIAESVYVVLIFLWDW